MGRLPDRNTKENIVFQAFLLFSKKPYNEVTFDDLEQVTGLSRGALLYHVKTKINLFNMVVESSLLNRTSILEIPIKEKDSLKFFIIDFINNCKNAIKVMKSHGINNMDLAHYNIESQALYYYENFNKMALQMRNTELKVWTQVVKKAIETKEIKEGLDAHMIASLFLNIYLGHVYTAAKEDYSSDLDLLKEELLALFDTIKS